ncbi:acyl-CoA dehydrogenase family protein [Thermus scotoductus]|uniref:glutaryl-CoA dehydrogenase (ETF) n=1 Tax=Thermus scotoductus TaxID=37636 RepID=A0A430RHU1_THESC|nr:acyl-CoA dehydrogenase family protein [Thermus scotoductus]RTG98609.1 acyl-CoA dehydrogenase [Thermus scotoductus]RTH01307.1 acyl-CoA dehydrogenase [Thermus scotoductus]RTH07917.1 acyl-CoA dehydrogenase [Thermus scotoductus]RTH17414.1 acyl-CoA dehydrogenase [Thermus scotoductus]RTH20290.1 acyl-CoA dehydrogenase [Thermus scotoductus]
MLDFYALEDLLTPEEKEIQKAARRFLEKEALPYIRDWWEEGVFPTHLIPRFAELGFLGPTLPPEYGGAGVSSAAYGLIAYELERVDSGLRSFVSVQSSLVMYPIYAFGSEEQKREFLPKLARGEMVGAFGLTEPDGGSDPYGNMKTKARLEGNTWVLNGTKMWITNGNLAHIALIWAKDEEGRVLGFIVPTDTPGFQAQEVKHKMSLRASVTSELVLEEVRVPEALRLPKAEGLKAPLSCLTQARFGIAWGVLGALEAVYTEAVEFAKSRSTFGEPIAKKQLVQAKLAEMLADHTEGLLLAWRLARLKDEGKLKPAQVSLAKRQNVWKALKAARLARDILGGSGITLEYHAIRHMLNLETVYTYEGTHDIHTLVLGREATGLSAF